MRGGERVRALCGTQETTTKKAALVFAKMKNQKGANRETHLCSVGMRRRQRLTHQRRRIVGADMVLSAAVTRQAGRQSNGNAAAEMQRMESESAAGRERKQEVENRTWKLRAGVLPQLSMARRVI